MITCFSDVQKRLHCTCPQSYIGRTAHVVSILRASAQHSYVQRVRATSGAVHPSVKSRYNGVMRSQRIVTADFWRYINLLYVCKLCMYACIIINNNNYECICKAQNKWSSDALHCSRRLRPKLQSLWRRRQSYSSLYQQFHGVGRPQMSSSSSSRSQDTIVG